MCVRDAWKSARSFFQLIKKIPWDKNILSMESECVLGGVFSCLYNYFVNCVYLYGT